jgi:UDP-glucuronate 4-epimerase
MIQELESALGVKAQLEPHPAQPGDVPQTWASIEKAHRLLGYEAKTRFQDGVTKFADWLVASTTPSLT